MPTVTRGEGPPRMDLEQLVAGLPVRALAGAARGVIIRELTEDSRRVEPGSLFVARRGTKTDGKRFVADALAAGAVALLTDDPALSAPAGSAAPVLFAGDLPLAVALVAERFFGNPTRALTLVGVTGTNGKTTTAHLVHQVFNSAGARCGLIGTVVVDDGREVRRMSMTTPPAIELSRLMATMVAAGCSAAVMETSSHALDQQRVAGLDYDTAVFTNLTGDHLDYHGTMEAYGAAKAKLFAMLPADGTAIVNAEDAASAQMAAASRAPVLACAIGEPGHPRPGPGVHTPCTATILSMSMAGTRVRFEGPWGGIDTTIRLVGRHNVMNALQALCVCHAAGVPAPLLERLIGGASPPPGRLEPVTGPGHPFAVFVDYAHTDDALRKVLATAAPLVRRDLGGRLAVAFGCGGDRDRTKRPRMGAAAAELADLVYITSDNPRSEAPGDIIDEILGGVRPAALESVSVEPDRRRAIVQAIERALPGDVILICGKGHETDQITSDGRGGLVKSHFDDREVAREALRRHGRAEDGTPGAPKGHPAPARTGAPA
ncbi:MAG: UDP-N-acetylmuramoyl-L-alanyl-D-glutamate--2,6-diaminopimelate ligase [Phycisphaerales bacterium]